MVIQLEDCIDVSQALHGNDYDYDYLFMFDHSNGHDKQRPDGLNANAMNKGFGGSQPSMRDVAIESEDQLGTYNPPGKLKVGETQHMNFDQPGDDGSCWMNAEEKAASKEDAECRNPESTDEQEMIRYSFKKTELVERHRARPSMAPKRTFKRDPQTTKLQSLKCV
ncbi:unnamed protein product [Cylindrotheca closterium]|uniref:Uncharacterized protein n=1 Tax=Cylindrotheca closterium TaxID=2856 RepID=A0AAD2CRD1_9STRA|nr:unnamed protein product [Cylindrotheca closterium]